MRNKNKHTLILKVSNVFAVFHLLQLTVAQTVWHASIFKWITSSFPFLTSTSHLLCMKNQQHMILWFYLKRLSENCMGLIVQHLSTEALFM